MLKKNAIAVQSLAREFMQVDLDQKLPTIKEFSEKIGLSVGTVQKAINKIIHEDGVVLQKRGVLGTFLRDIDMEKLWELSGSQNIVCVMPLPYLKRYEGLATGIKNNLKDKLYFAHMRGAKTRVKFLEKNIYDCAVLSKKAAKEYIKEGYEIEIALEFGRETYTGQHLIVYNNKAIKRVGIDRNSKDHEILTIQNFPEVENFVFIDLQYNEILDSLKNNIIDSAIWNMDNLKDSRLDLPYTRLNSNLYASELSEAVIVIKKDNEWLKKFLRRKLNIQNIIKSQLDVINHKQIPNY